MSVVSGTTITFSGGYTYWASGHTFDTTDCLTAWRWHHDGLIIDLDGSVSGSGVAMTKLLPEHKDIPPSCITGTDSGSKNIGRGRCHIIIHHTLYVTCIEGYTEQDIFFLLRKIALPYPHKCLFGFVEQNVSTDKNFLRNILVTRGDPFVCACPRLRSSGCRQTIVERSSLYFWSIWEQHVLFLIIVHSRMKIYEVLKRASVQACTYL